VKAEGLTKKDWQNWLIGGFISAIASLVLNPTQAGEVLKLVKAAFGGCFCTRQRERARAGSSTLTLPTIGTFGQAEAVRSLRAPRYCPVYPRYFCMLHSPFSPALGAPAA